MDFEVKSGFYDVIKWLVPEKDARLAIDKQIDLFKSAGGMFEHEMAIETRETKQLVDLEIRASDGAGTIGTIEDSTGGELAAYEGSDASQEPYEGLVFESEDAAKVFYDEYARRVGFIGRIVSSRRSERDGSFISRKLACNKEGFNLSSRKIDRVRIRKRQSQREGCMAMMLVKRQKPGKWVVTKFVKEHNHPLVINANKDRPTPDEKDKKIQELSSELNRANRRLAACQEQLSVFMKLLEDHTQHLTGTVAEIVSNVREIEAEDQELISHHR